LIFSGFWEFIKLFWMHYIYVEVTELIFHWRTNLPEDTLYYQMRKKYNHCWYEYKFLCIKIQANEWLCLLVNLPIDFSFFEKSLWKRLSIIIYFNYNCFFEKKWPLNILKWFWKRKKMSSKHISNIIWTQGNELQG